MPACGPAGLISNHDGDSMPLKVYLAGPEVFMPDARLLLKRKAELAREAGFIPLSPGDLDVPAATSKFARGVSISRINEGLIREADAIVANLTPFRGIAADIGRSFELGFMCALGKHVYAYTNVRRSHFERCDDHYQGAVTHAVDGCHRGPDGISVEDFDMADNLMLDGGVANRGGVLVVGDADPADLYRDMTAYRRCLVMLAAATAGKA